MNDYDTRKQSEYGKAKLYYLIGLARSGKSTLAKAWASKEPNRIVLSRDPFRYVVYDCGWNADREPEMKKVFYSAVDALMMNEDLEIMIDDTNINAASRQKWIDRGGIGILVDTPLEECLNRVPDGDESIMKFKESIKGMDETLKRDPLPSVMITAKDFFQ